VVGQNYFLEQILGKVCQEIKAWKNDR